VSRHSVSQHLDKVLRAQKAAPVAFDQPHFLFDSPRELPAFGEHQLCVVPFEGHLADLKMIEWREVLAELLRDDGSDLVDTSDLQLEPLS